MRKLTLGVTLIETIVVLAIFMALAFLGTEAIFEFQKNALLEGEANQLASVLRLARTKTLAGELCKSDDPAVFKKDGLPQFGVQVADQNYFLFCDYELKTGEVGSADLESFTVENSLTLLPGGGRVVFERLTGKTSSFTFSLERNDGGGRKEIEVNNQGINILP